MSTSRDALIPRATTNFRVPLSRFIFLLAVLAIIASACFLAFNHRNQVAVMLEASSENLENQLLRQQIANLTSELSKANRTIAKLRMDLLKCKKAPSASDESKSEESESKEEGDSDTEDQERYRQYLLNFKINDQAQRDYWPWSDNTLYYDKLGGENGIQYSEADAAVDAGRAEQYGRDRAFTTGDLDASLTDPRHNGEGR